VKYEKQFRLRDELNAQFPRRRGNLGQQMFRSAYYNGRMAGQSVADAIRIGVAIVRLYVPNFVPITA
jgi:hypothetical protein